MKRILLTVGPQGAGKTTFCRKIAEKNLPNVTYASRDEFLVERYGKNAWNPDLVHIGMAEDVFLEKVKNNTQENEIVLLECFSCTENHFLNIKKTFCSKNNPSEYLDFLSRMDLLLEEDDSEEEKEFSFEALFFHTPPEICAKQLIDRQYPNETDLMRCFYYKSATIDSIEFYEEAEKFRKYFDVIWEINSPQQLIFPIENVLGLV